MGKLFWYESKSFSKGYNAGMLVHDPAFILFTGIWFALLGACVGSFLNVLIYRLPRKESLVHPPSHCPRCGCMIRWYDNVPVAGWLNLRGQCRECRQAISVRYPCVEGVCAILFGIIFVLLGQLDGLAFGYRVCLTLLCSFLVCGIFAVGLMRYDKKKGAP